jgi:hypothetical protein
MNGDWQTFAAAAVVALTALVFLLRFVRRSRSSGGCGGNCSCSAKPTAPGKRPRS